MDNKGKGSKGRGRGRGRGQSQGGGSGGRQDQGQGRGRGRGRGRGGARGGGGGKATLPRLTGAVLEAELRGGGVREGVVRIMAHQAYVAIAGVTRDVHIDLRRQYVRLGQ